MTFIETIPPEQASGAVARMYDGDRKNDGRVPNSTRAFSLRPDVHAAWKAFGDTIRGGMELRRYELATIAAARRLRSSYCMLAHGSVLLDQFLSPDALKAVATDHRTAGLDAVDVAEMDLADKIADDATAVTQDDIDRLRSLGRSDAEILDVILAAALRCFTSKVMDAVGALPDPEYNDIEPGVRDALVVGRPIENQNSV
jgi:uncharacterized peroxidase-related enzyme